MMKQLTQFSSPDSRGNWLIQVPAKLIKELQTELNETKAELEREQQDCAALRQMVCELRDALEQCRYIIGSPDSLPNELWRTDNEIEDAWNASTAAITKANQLLP